MRLIDRVLPSSSDITGHACLLALRWQHGMVEKTALWSRARPQLEDGHML
jgi:hypothetical protein